MIPSLIKLNRYKVAWAIFLLLYVLIVLCANPWKLYFLNDDLIHVPKASYGIIGQHNMLRHVSEFSLYLNSLISKRNPVGYHLVNLLLHLANGLLVISFWRKLFVSFNILISNYFSIAIGGLFAVYAFHSEALFWIICRGASLSLFFTLLSWLSLFAAKEKPTFSFATILFFLLGLFTYESVWVYPVWLLMWYYLLPRDSKFKVKTIRWNIAAIWLLFAAYLPLRMSLTGEWLGTYHAADIQQFQIVPIIGKTVKLIARSFLPPMQNSWLFAGLSVVAVTCFSLLIFYAIKKKNKHFLVFTIAAWLISYLPYISLGVSTKGYESERYLYFPSFFLVAILLYTGYVIWQKLPTFLYTFITLLFIYHICFFLKVTVAFQSVSNYAKNGITAINKVPLQKKVFIQNLPSYGYGIPVFNYGFFEGLNWVASGRDSFNTIIINKTNFYKQPVEVSIIHGNEQSDTVRFTPTKR